MTDDEKRLLKSSAILCKQWNDFHREIKIKQSQIQDIKKIENEYNKSGEEYAKKQEKRFLNVIKGFFGGLLMYIVIPFLPIALFSLNICLKNQIQSFEQLSTYFQSPVGEHYLPGLKFLFGLALVLVAFVFILNFALSKFFEKRKHNHYLSEFSKNNFPQYNKRINEINKKMTN